jgi:hypothetical protein
MFLGALFVAQCVAFVLPEPHPEPAASKDVVVWNTASSHADSIIL